MGRPSASVRRSRYLVTYWEHGAHVFYNYATQTVYRGDARASAILEFAEDWTRRSALRDALAKRAEFGGRRQAEKEIDALLAHDALESADRPAPAAAAALDQWGRWNPVAAFFHRATHRLPEVPPDADEQRERRVLIERSHPSPNKRYARRAQVALPTDFGRGPFARTLLRRRTWRSFGPRPLALAELSTLLGLTFGVQGWLDIGDERWVALKTSPSGGARHSIEAYLLAFDVAGLAAGTYHYDPDAHALTRLAARTSRRLLNAFIPNQPGFHDCSAVVVMTSVFERVQWKYDFARAYRVVLLDAGHLGQTFALTATALGLAPFCTAAIDDPRIERHLGIDGVSESALFLVGVGPMADGARWMPGHDPAAPPLRTAAPAWTARATQEDE